MYSSCSMETFYPLTISSPLGLPRARGISDIEPLSLILLIAICSLFLRQQPLAVQGTGLTEANPSQRLSQQMEGVVLRIRSAPQHPVNKTQDSGNHNYRLTTQDTSCYSWHPNPDPTN